MAWYSARFTTLLATQILAGGLVVGAIQSEHLDYSADAVSADAPLADGPFDPRAARCDPVDPNDPAQGPTLELWQHPTDATIIDGFRPPSNPYGPGNRGLEYDTASGDPVYAASPGAVVFAGQVGGRLFIVAQHPLGFRVTYSYLDQINVEVGVTIVAGEPIAVAGSGMHLTVRDGGTYIDPLPFMADYRCYVVRLVPVPNLS